jgi:hypothetical protein
MALTVQYIGDRPQIYLGPGKGSRNPTAAELKTIQSNPGSIQMVDRYGKPMAQPAVNQQQQQIAAQQAEAARLAQLTQQQQMAELQARQRAEAEAAQRARDQAAAQAEQQRQAQLAEQRRIAEAAEAQRVAQQAEQQRQAQLAEQQRQAQQAEQARIAQQQAQAQAEQQRQAAAQAEAQRLLRQPYDRGTLVDPVLPGPPTLAPPVPTPQPTTPGGGYQPLNYTFDTRTPFKGVNIPSNLGSITAVQGGRPVWSRTPTQGGTTVAATPVTGTSSWGKSSTAPATSPAPVAPR